jgi:hypothetical protein
MARLSPLEQAQETALRGDTDDAVAQLTKIVGPKNLGAAAALAEIEAFRGQWQDLLRHEFAFMHRPDSVYAGNVFADARNLVALAGLKTGAWTEIENQTKSIRDELFAKSSLKQYVDGTSRDASGMDQLIEFARSKGKSAFPWDLNSDGLSEDALAKEWQSGMAYIDANTKNKTERVGSYFDYACNIRAYRAGAQLFDEFGFKGTESFDTHVFVASSLARAKRADEAWEVVEQALRHWVPVDPAQMAPVLLLIDEGLRPLMTPERCQWVLSTPRGPGAEKVVKKFKNFCRTGLIIF